MRCGVPNIASDIFIVLTILRYYVCREANEDDTITGNRLQMAGDLLKSPSRKAIAATTSAKPLKAKQQSKFTLTGKTVRATTREESPNPFVGDDSDEGEEAIVADKENMKDGVVAASQSKAKSRTASGAQGRSARSRNDKTQPMEKLPNPFQKKVLEAKKNTSKKPGQKAAPRSEAGKLATTSALAPEIVSAQQGEERATDEKSVSPLPQAQIEAVSAKESNTASPHVEVEEVLADKAASPNLGDDVEDDLAIPGPLVPSEEEIGEAAPEKSEHIPSKERNEEVSSKRTNTAASQMKSPPVLSRATSAQRDNSTASTAFVSAKGEADNDGHSDSEDSFGHSMDDDALPFTELDENDEPRESTPPPKSTQEIEGESAARQARLRLDQSLARLQALGNDQSVESEDENEGDYQEMEDDQARESDNIDIGQEPRDEDISQGKDEKSAETTLNAKNEKEVADALQTSEVEESKEAKEPQNAEAQDIKETAQVTSPLTTKAADEEKGSGDTLPENNSKPLAVSDGSAMTLSSSKAGEDLGISRLPTTSAPSSKRALSSFSTAKKTNVAVGGGPIDQTASTATNTRLSFLSKSLRMASSDNHVETEKHIGHKATAPTEEDEGEIRSTRGKEGASLSPSSSTSSKKRKSTSEVDDEAAKAPTDSIVTGEVKTTENPNKLRKVSSPEPSAIEEPRSSGTAYWNKLRGLFDPRPPSQSGTLARKVPTSPILGRSASQMGSKIPKSPPKAKGLAPGSEPVYASDVFGSPGKSAKSATISTTKTGSTSSVSKPSRLPVASTTPTISPTLKTEMRSQATVASPPKAGSPLRGTSKIPVKEIASAVPDDANAPKDGDVGIAEEKHEDDGSSADDETSDCERVMEEIDAGAAKIKQQQPRPQTRPPGAALVRSTTGLPKTVPPTSHTIKPPYYKSSMAQAASTGLSGKLNYIKSVVGFGTAAPVSASDPKRPSTLTVASQSTYSVSSSSSFVPKTIHNTTGAKAGATSKASDLARSGSSSKSQSVLRAEAARKKEADKTREQEERRRQSQAQANAYNNKRDREEVKATQPRLVSGQHKNGENADTGKKRKSNEGVAVPVKATQLSTSATHKLAKPASQQNLRLAQPSGVVRSTATTTTTTTTTTTMSHKTSSQQLQGTKPAQQKVAFSNQNVFQMAKPPASAATNSGYRPTNPQAHQSQAQPAKAPVKVLSPLPTPAPAPQSKPKEPEPYIELEEPNSFYSDSDDEEVIARRAKHKEWETPAGLEAALLAQANIDPDEIFGIPSGNVPLDEMIPPESEQEARARRRPRSSSANWSGTDALQQSEIDWYNKRMGIIPSWKRAQLAAQAVAGEGGASTVPASSAANAIQSPLSTSSLAQDARMQARHVSK